MPSVLIKSIQAYINHEVTASSSKILDEFESSVIKAIDFSILCVVNAIIDKSSNDLIINSIYILVDKISNSSEGILFNPSNSLVESNESTNLGINLLDLLFDKNSNIISNEISSTAFIKRQSTNKILIMTSLVVLSYFSKKEISKKDIQKYKVDNENTIIEEIKNEETTFAPVQELDSIVLPIEIESKVETTNKVKSAINSDSFFNKNKTLFIIVSIVLVFGLLFKYVTSTKDSGTNSSIDKPIVVDSETQSQVITGQDATKLGDFLDFTLPSDAILHIPEKGFEKKMLDLILDNSNSLDGSSWWLIFDGVYFDNRETDFKIDSENQIKNLAGILNSFPKVKIKISSYTDNLGKPESNLVLSEARAQSVRSALIKLGVQANRMTAEGFGNQFSIASNDTEEGRAENRRVALKIIEK
ncbi:OmpA family protein [Flavobacterium sp.]|uniref:OmpA family protein n=1 Tax=Flavobacterium sp. TaxID=239 RepID=UPI00286E557C|nr:OmpA family protein [Flavobacterium sp.]